MLTRTQVALIDADAFVLRNLDTLFDDARSPAAPSSVNTSQFATLEPGSALLDSLSAESLEDCGQIVLDLSSLDSALVLLFQYSISGEIQTLFDCAGHSSNPSTAYILVFGYACMNVLLLFNMIIGASMGIEPTILAHR